MDSLCTRPLHHDPQTRCLLKPAPGSSQRLAWAAASAVTASSSRHQLVLQASIKLHSELQTSSSCAQSMYVASSCGNVLTRMHTCCCLQVLDARDPLACRCPDVERYIRSISHNKRIILLLNKMDLVPREVGEKWLAYFRWGTSEMWQQVQL